VTEKETILIEAKPDVIATEQLKQEPDWDIVEHGEKWDYARYGDKLFPVNKKKKLTPWGYRDTLRLLRAPCPQVCGRTDIGRFHFSCLTCLERRLAFNKGGSEKLRRYKQILMVYESVSGKGFVFPKKYRVYGLVLRSDLGMLRRYALKALLTLAERIAEA